MKLPKKTQEILQNYLLPASSYDIPEELLVLMHYTYVSFLLCYNRVRIKGYSTSGFPNLYTIVFMPSGSGKDYSTTLVDRMYKLVREEQDRYEYAFTEMKRQEVEDFIMSECGKDGKNWSGPQKQNYREQHSPRTLERILSEGTREGLSAYRAAFTESYFGCVLYKNSEFVDLITESKKETQELLSFQKDVYETGDDPAKGIKTEKKIIRATDVPLVSIIMSSLSGIENDQKTLDNLHSFLSRGFARRSIICAPDMSAFAMKQHTPDDVFRFAKTANEYLPEAQRYMAYLNAQTLAEPLKGKEQVVMTLTEEAEREYIYYHEEKKMEYLNFNESVGAESKDRGRRVLRLAACIAAFEHPEDMTIHALDVHSAIELVEYYAKQFMRVLHIERNTIGEKLYYFIKESQDNRDITKMIIRKQSFIPNNMKTATAKVQEALEGASEIAAENGEVIKEIKGEKNKFIYRIEPYEEPVVETEGDTVVRLSFTASAQEHPVEGYKPVERPFSKLGKDITKGYCYSAALFKDGYRKGSNVAAHGNVIIIDIDDGLSIEEAKERVGHIKSLIVTTQSHRKKKKDKVADRYRIIIPTRLDIMPEHDYRNVIEGVLKYLNLFDEADVAATCDPARYFKPSPKGAEVWYSESNQLIDWKQFDTEQKIIVRRPKVKVSTESEYSLPESQVFEYKNHVYAWDDFEHLGADETEPVRCIYPEKHKGGDKHPSAFIGRHKEGSLMFKCSGCGSLGFRQ